jgi:hypothetical protein
MFRKITALTVLLIALTMITTSCDQDNPQQNRSVIYIESLNDNVAPVVSDIITNGTVFPDAINVVFRNRPYSRIIVTAPDKPYGDYEFTRYTVEWSRADGGAVMPPYSADLGLTVPSEYSAEANITIVTWENKANPPLSTIPAATQVNMNAKITFYGHEVGSDDETEVVAKIGVIFADFADPAP